MMPPCLFGGAVLAPTLSLCEFSRGECGKTVMTKKIPFADFPFGAIRFYVPNMGFCRRVNIERHTTNPSAYLSRIPRACRI